MNLTISFFWTDSHEDYAGCHVPLVNSPGATRLHLKLRLFLKPPALLSPDITLILMWNSQPCGLVTVWLNRLKLCSTWLSMMLRFLFTASPELFISSFLLLWVSMLCCVIPLSVCTQPASWKEAEREWEIF